MRILFVAPTSFFADYGCHVRILEQVRAAQRLGWETRLCTYSTGRDWPGFSIERTPGLPWRKQAEVGSSWHKLALDVLLLGTSLRASRRFRPQLVHAFLHEGALIGSVLRAFLHVPLVFDFQGSLTSEMVDHGFLRRRSPLYTPLCRLETSLDRCADLVLVNSSHAANLLIRSFGVRPERVHLVSDAADCDHFRPPGPVDRENLRDLRRRLGLPGDRPLVAYLGLLASYQGTDLLLEAIRQFLQRGGQAHFLIMGFPHLDRYQALAQELGVDGATTFTGPVPYVEAPQHLMLADLAVAPKISATEGSGKVLAYMAAGLPVVAFDTPVHREYLGDLGLYVPREDAAALADRLGSALADRTRLRGRGLALRDRSLRSYGPDAISESLRLAYQRLPEAQQVGLT